MIKEDEEMEEQIKHKDWVVNVEDVPKDFFGWTFEDVEKEILKHIDIREVDKEGCEV